MRSSHDLTFSALHADASVRSSEGESIGTMRTLGTRPNLPRVRFEAAAASPIQHRPRYRQLLCIPLAVQPGAVMSSDTKPFDKDQNWQMVLPPNKWVSTSCLHATLAREPMIHAECITRLHQLLPDIVA